MSSDNKIAYLGPAGTFTEMAAKMVPGAAASQLIPHASVSEALDAVLSGACHRAVAPIENSLEGGVSATSDALATIPGVQIYGEYLVPVSFDLMVRPGTKLEDITEVLTHPVAYAQSRKWLAENLKQHSHVPAASTAAAAKALANGSTAHAAIAATAAAAIYGLEIIASNIGGHVGENRKGRHDLHLALGHGSARQSDPNCKCRYRQNNLVCHCTLQNTYTVIRSVNANHSQ